MISFFFIHNEENIIVNKMCRGNTDLLKDDKIVEEVKAMKKYQQTVKYLIIILILILAMQFYDSYCASIFDRIQSLFLSELVIDKLGMETDEAVAYLNRFMPPFFLIGAMAPGARMLVDRFGKRIVCIVNMFVLIVGCVLCMMAPNLITYLLGNGIVIFGTTMDIQYIYLVEDMPKKWHATVRGIAGGIAAGTAMLIPVFRKIMLENEYTWRGLYGVGICIGIMVIILSFLLKEGKHKPEIDREKQKENYRIKEIYNYISENKCIRQDMLLLFLLGISVAGITFYNEPLVAFGLQNEEKVNVALLTQPLVTLCITVVSGWLADIISRRKVLLGNLLLTILGVSGFLFGIYNMWMPSIIGGFWGVMIGSFFAMANLLTLMVMEEAPKGRTGIISAVSTYINGAGNAVGILLSCIIIQFLQMEHTKIILTIPVLFVVFLVILIHRKSG